MDQTRRGLMGLVAACATAGDVTQASAANTPVLAEHPMIAGVWHGRTSSDRAEEYRQYLFDVGVKRIAALPGNRGVQMMMAKTAGHGEFMVISFWDSVDVIKGYAGADYTRVHDLPRDADFLIDKEPLVHHFDLGVNIWQS